MLYCGLILLHSEWTQLLLVSVILSAMGLRTLSNNPCESNETSFKKEGKGVEEIAEKGKKERENEGGVSYSADTQELKAHPI